MADSTYVTLKAVIAKLKANSNLVSVVGTKVYNDVPQQTAFPYCLVEIQSEPWDTDEDANMQHTIRVHGFSNKPSNSVAVRIAEYSYEALNRQEGSITLDSGDVVLCQFSGVKTTLKEPDGDVWHSVIEFNLMVD